MSQKKTEFKFQVNADPTQVEAVIRNYLTAKGFQQVPKPGANYYFYNEPLVEGKKSFEYYINGNEVTILAYIGTYEKPKALEGFVAAVPKQAYRNELNKLMEELKKLENAAGATGAGTDPYGSALPEGASPYDAARTANGAVPPNNSLNSFMDENDRKRGKLAIIGFVMSLLGLVLSLFGYTYGVVLLILEFYFGTQGLKSSKKGFAVATIVLACVSILILIVEIILIAMGTMLLS